MYIHEVIQQIEVDTPMGRGRILYISEFGMEIEKLFTVVMNETGEFWEFTNAQIRAASNLTFGRATSPRMQKIMQAGKDRMKAMKNNQPLQPNKSTPITPSQPTPVQPHEPASPQQPGSPEQQPLQPSEPTPNLQPEEHSPVSTEVAIPAELTEVLQGVENNNHNYTENIDTLMPLAQQPGNASSRKL